MKISPENSWWNEGGLWQDPDLKRVKESILVYRPQPFSPAECREDAVLTLRGPRRVGKTVSLKLLVAQLIEAEGWEPHAILWTALDTLRTLSQLEHHLVSLAETYRPKLLLIDEVTAVTGWQRVIKKLRDDGTLAEMCIILTGSSAHDLKAGAERMAGRRGEVPRPDRVLLPMSFGDFMHQSRASGDVAMDPAQLARAYLKVGGFPFRVEAFFRCVREARPWEPLLGFQVFDDVVFYEFNRRRLDRSIALEIVGRLGSIGVSAMSYEAFAKPLSMVKETARKYLDALGDAFLLATISSYDTARSRVAPKKDRKFVWIDSALGGLPAWFRQGELPIEAACAEWAVGAELLRRCEARVWEGLSAPRNVFTWKSSGGNELDYLVVDKSRKILFPVEVKYQTTISDWDFQVMERAFGKGMLVTLAADKSRPKTKAIPLWQFLSSNGEFP